VNKTVRKLLAALGFHVEQISVDELYRIVGEALREEFVNDKKDVYVVDLYEDHVVFELHDDGVPVLYKQSYVKDEDKVALADDRVQVKLERKYVPVVQEKKENAEDADVKKEDLEQGVKNTPNVQDKKGSKMDRELKIQELLATGKWMESDKEFLTGLSDERLLAIHTAFTVKPEPKVEPPVVQEKAKETASVGIEVEPPTLDAFMKTAPPEVAAVLKQKLAENEKYSEKMRAFLSDGDTPVYSKEELQEKGVTELEKLVRLAQTPRNFEGRLVGSPLVGNGAGGAGQEKMTAPPIPALFAKKDVK